MFVARIRAQQLRKRSSWHSYESENPLGSAQFWNYPRSGFASTVNPSGALGNAVVSSDIRRGFVEAVGRTPLIRLRKISERTGCEVLGKAEFLNPGGSIKDRAARQIVLDAEARGELSPGGVIVEGTGGNTGIGLALVARARGYRSVIVIPENQSQEKKDLLTLCGAELHLAPVVPYREPGNYVRTAERLAEELRAREPGGVLYANQWDNPSNREAHERGTGPEIWEQSGERVDGFVCAIGTGGTISGIGAALRARNPSVVVALSDPGGSAMGNYFEHGELRAEGSSITEGIGQGRMIGNVESAAVDRVFRISDAEALERLFELLAEEGLCLGGSSGINVAGAERLARELGPGHTVVTVLCDHGQRYQSKLYNPTFLRENGLPRPSWLE